MKNENLYHYILEIADNNLILGQRLGELCGHGPELETDIACTNISLDLLGQVRNYYQYAAAVQGEGKTEDDIAFLRRERQYKNVLLVEQPSTNFAHTVVRQFLFDVFHLLFINALQNSTDETLSAIAKKSIKEVLYHQRFSADWVKRLGDGTAESKQKMQEAVNALWVYTDELFHETEASKAMLALGIAVDTEAFKEEYYQRVTEVLTEATLEVPENKWFQKGGKQGVHTEYLGFLLSDLQYMQRTYPGQKW